MNGTTAYAPAPQPHSRRYGTLPARIGTMHERRMALGFMTRNGGAVLPGGKAYFRVEDLTRHPEAGPHTKWVCCHAGCAGKEWASKGELLAAHADNRELARREETHLFYAVADLPEVPARQPKIEKGRIVEAGAEARPAQVMLLSDEE